MMTSSFIVYFTVISLTTVGFGDYSPSFKGSEETGITFMAAYRILVLFWMMIGLAWLGSLLSISSDRFGTFVANYMDKVWTIPQSPVKPCLIKLLVTESIPILNPASSSGRNSAVSLTQSNVLDR